MAFKQIQTDNNIVYGVVQFACDTPEDIEKLPVKQVAMGSSAFIISTGDVYFLNSEKIWVKI